MYSLHLLKARTTIDNTFLSHSYIPTHIPTKNLSLAEHWYTLLGNHFSFHLTVFVLQETWWCHFYFQHKGVIVKKMAIGCGGVWCKVLQFLITECCCQQSVVHSHKKRNNLKWLRTRKGEGRGGGRGGGGWNEGTWVNLDKGRGPQEVCVCTAALSLEVFSFLP